MVAVACIAALAFIVAGLVSALLISDRRLRIAERRATSAEADAKAAHAALALQEYLSCAVCRTWRLLPDVMVRRAPQHPS